MAEDKDHIITNWLSGNLSSGKAKDELGEETVRKYVQILNEVDSWIPGQADFAVPVLPRKKPQGIRISTWPGFSIAASVLVMMSLAYLWWSGATEEYVAANGTLHMVLPNDDTAIDIADGSSISYNKRDWENGLRSLSLEGMAYFNVAKGSTFTVATNTGHVQVLGTRFTVDSYDNDLYVACYEGRVQVINNDGESRMLSKGQSISHEGDDWSEIEQLGVDMPSWLEGELTFSNVPMSRVLASIERTFKVTIEAEGIDLERKYTGKLPSEALEKALRLVCTSMGWQYVISDNQVKLTKAS